MTQDLAGHFIAQLGKFDKRSFRSGDAAELQLLKVFIRHFITTFMSEDFSPPRATMLEFIERNETIANLMYIAGLDTTESLVASLLPRISDDVVLYKLMTLYSARNTLQLLPAIFFVRDAEAASIWYATYTGYIDWACIDAERMQRIRRMLGHIDDRLQFVYELGCPYFTCTFVEEACVAPLRRRIHSLMAKLAPPLPALPAAGTNRRIGFVTDRWKADNVVHRSLAPFLHALAAGFELILIHHRDDISDWDLQGFAGTERYHFDRDKPDAVQALAGRFGMLLFADIGMSVESIQLASLRLAPVQVALCGHPESSWSPTIDYFVHGADVIEASLAHEQFSERLVLIPGYGHLCTRPPYEWQRLQLPQQELRIACCWSAQKINPEHLQHLAAAARDVSRPVKFVFLGLTGNCLLPILRGLQELLGADSVEAWGGLSYSAYMTKLEGCHFAVDSWPFGGCLTVTDLLWLRKPVVTLRGKRSFNRNAAYFETRLGMSDMVVDTPDDFIALLRRMMIDDEYRGQVIARLQQADVETLLLSRAPVPAFVAAITMLLADHDKLQADGSREPLRVTA